MRLVNLPKSGEIFVKSLFLMSSTVNAVAPDIDPRISKSRFHRASNVQRECNLPIVGGNSRISFRSSLQYCKSDKEFIESCNADSLQFEQSRYVSFFIQHIDGGNNLNLLYEMSRNVTFVSAIQESGNRVNLLLLTEMDFNCTKTLISP